MAAGQARSGPAALVAAVFIAAFAALVPSTAGARTRPLAATSVRLDARVGFDGAVRSLTATPLTVLIESDSLFAGTIQIRIQGSSGVSALERAIEVPGGSRKELTVLLPRPDLIAVRAVDRSGRVLGEATPSQGVVLRMEPLVGVIADVDQKISHVTVPPIGADARVVRVPLPLLELGADAIRSLSHLVVDAPSAARLSARQRNAVIGFTESGGELIAASPSEAALSFLPPGWRGSGGGEIRRTSAGLGHVTVALSTFGGESWSASGGMWRRVLRPGDAALWRGDELGSSEWIEALSNGSGFRRPPITWLLAFVLIYVAVAGPLNFIVLARLRRRELAWITVPAIALLFAGGAYAAGRGVRNVPIRQGIGIMVFDGAVQRTSIALGVLSRSGGHERLHIPADWLTEPLAVAGNGFSAGLPNITLQGDASIADFDLPIGAIGTVAARSVRVTQAQQAGTLVADGARFTGTVRNALPYALGDAGVYVGRSFTGIGTIGPGATAGVTVEGSQDPVPGFDPPPFIGNFSGEGDVYSLLLRANRVAGLGDAGRPFLVGWVSLQEAGPSLGIGRTPGRLLVLQPLGLSSKRGGSVINDAIRREIIQTDGNVDVGGPALMVDGAKSVVVRFNIPAGMRSVTITVPDESGFVKVFPAPPIIGGVQGGGVAVAPPVPDQQAAPQRRASIYDFTNDRWRSVSVVDGRLSLALTGAGSRYLQDGQIIIRVESDFQQQLFVNNFIVSGETA
jgi:hypothetical protein